MNVAFVLAHQDDEVACASRIRFCIARGDRVIVVFLTDGASRVSSGIRDAESRAALKQLGVDDIRFIGSRERIADGSLPEHLERALQLLDGELEHVDEVVTLAWEGGHQDHDAAHLVAAVFAKRRGVTCLELPLYNGHRAGPLFRVNHPLDDGWSSRKLPLKEKLATLRLLANYRSQRTTWLGLAPLLLLARNRELTRVVDLQRAAVRPHRGSLLYERRFHYPYDRFAANAATFLQQQSARD